MGLFIGSTVINTPDIHEASAFWTAALGYVVRNADSTFAVDRDGEVSRLEGLGATRVVPWEYTADHDHIVMAAPDGNEFCVIQSPYRQD